MGEELRKMQKKVIAKVKRRHPRESSDGPQPAKWGRTTSFFQRAYIN
jgi:hypothetical protein